jgi:hypothetical protein
MTRPDANIAPFASPGNTRGGRKTVIAAIGMPATWATFNSKWPSFVRSLAIGVWHQRDICNRRKGYGSLTTTGTSFVWNDQKLAKPVTPSSHWLSVDAQFFIAGAAIGRQTYETGKGCLKMAIARDLGTCIYYDAAKQHGRIARELLRWHKRTFEPNYLSQYRDRIIEIEFGDGGGAGGLDVPDIIAFAACVRADTGIPFLGANLVE